MKLIEVLVKKHNEEGWEWPENAKYCWQDWDKEVRFFNARGFYTPNLTENHREKHENNPVPGDDKCLTREQYEAAIAASKEMLINKPQPVWNGDGLPPVGCECERSWCGDKWLVCTVLFIGLETVVVKLPTREASYDITSVKFRPIRTEAERKRDEVTTALRLCLTGTGAGITEKAAKLIYQAIKEGKIPGLMEVTDA